MTIRQVAAALLLGLTTACASGGQARPDGEAGERTTSPDVRRRSDVISTAELEQNRNRGSAHELILGLRPQWLRIRGTVDSRDTQNIRVYVNDSPVGNQEVLKDITASGIIAIRFLSPLQATTRFGRGHEHGAILITSH